MESGLVVKFFLFETDGKHGLKHGLQIDEYKTRDFSSLQLCTGPQNYLTQRTANSLLQPVPWKMRLEMVIGMQIEILIGIKKLPFYGFFQIFNWKETYNNSFMIPIRISICIPTTISSLIFHGTGCTTAN